MSFLHSFTIPALALSLALGIPGGARAAGSSDDEPPAPTETTTKCEEGQVWDDKKEECVDAEEGGKTGRLDNDTLYRAVRELAYAREFDRASMVLAAMSEGDSDRVLTYKGFIARKTGHIDEGMAFYAAALEQDPDNLLTRSYMGQAYVEMGEFDLAQAELDQIVARGGTGTWPEVALRRAIATGQTATY
jgi:hypothetical protein